MNDEAFVALDGIVVHEPCKKRVYGTNVRYLALVHDCDPAKNWNGSAPRREPVK